MEPTSGSYQYLKVKKIAPPDEYLNPKETKELLSTYESGVIPLSELSTPTFTTKETSEHTNTDLMKTMQEFQGDEKNIEIAKCQVESCNKSFARAHPILTGGIIVGVILLLVGVGIAVHALLGHATLTVMHQQVALGGGIAIMAIYYGVCVINMARRTALKEEAQKQLELAENLREEVSERSQKNIEDVIDRLNRRIEELEKQKIQDYNQAVAIRNEIKNYRNQLLKVIEKELPKTRLPFVQNALNLANGILQAPNLLLDPTQPQTPFVTEITIPDAPTKEMEKNSKTAEQMQGTFSKLLNFVKENPSSVLLMVGGLAIAALGGYGAFLYLHGATSLYFFGALSVTTIAPFIIYGLSLAYEGYFNSETNRINKQLEALRTKDMENLRKITEGEEILKDIENEGNKVLESFGQEWEKYQNQQGIDIKAIPQMQFIKGQCEAILGMLGLLSHVDNQQGLNVLLQPFKYALENK